MAPPPTLYPASTPGAPQAPSSGWKIGPWGVLGSLILLGATAWGIGRGIRAWKRRKLEKEFATNPEAMAAAAIASALNPSGITALADMDGTNEEAIFAQFAKQLDWAKVADYFRTITGKSMLDKLRSDLSAEEFAKIEQVMQAGGGGSNGAPLVNNPNRAWAIKLQKALEGWGTDEDTVLDVMKNAPDPKAMAVEYKALTGRSAYDDIRADIAGQEWEWYVAGPLQKRGFVPKDLSGIPSRRTDPRNTALCTSSWAFGYCPTFQPVHR